MVQRCTQKISGFSDFLAEDELDALRMCRNVVAHLNIYKKSSFSISAFKGPKYDPNDLLGLFSEDLKSPVDIREVIMRVVDESRFEEFKPLYGSTMVCGWSNVFGYPVGIIGNNGPIYPESAEKSASFIQLCNQSNIPLVFLHNVTGFLVGKDYERQGIIKKGAQLINAVSNSTVPTSALSLVHLMVLEHMLCQAELIIIALFFHMANSKNCCNGTKTICWGNVTC